MQANKRNTKVKIAKAFIENSFIKDKIFSRSDIESVLFVREKEFESFKEQLFIEADRGGYRVDPDFFEEILKWKKFHNSSKESIETAKVEYKKMFQSFECDYNYPPVFDKITPLFNQLHWYFLPVYKDHMIDNRGVIPEENINEYYNHFHSLQDLYKIIDSTSNNWKSLKGDVNLNQVCDFPVYTNRWGHEDNYKVTRTFNGWSVENLGIGGACSPEGKSLDKESESGFIANFEQDFVDYPSKFHYIIERLWNLADETEMDIKELQSKLYEVAKLVSEVEKTISRNTPDWY
ncbi:hypothetical protein [Labilibacter marinus]|uniref:hypothetical protein n=1 Tax=Labilibacter marinus TaxID=1477105 RepID=UPI000836C96B|nr:hypothetical protein [Labilibacter marinus]